MNDDPWNFVILYHAREGSSAIVDMLGQHPNIRVPLFEEMNKPNFRRLHPGQELDEVLSGVWNSGVYPPVESKARPASENSTSVGFKWSYWGNRKRLADALLQARVKVFFLARRDFSELVASRYITEIAPDLLNNALISKHPQFHAAALEAEEKQSFIAKMSELRVPLRPIKISMLAAALAKSRLRHWKFARYLRGKGVPIQAIYYEDFAADNQSFIQDFAKELGVGGTAPAEPSRFVKVMQKPAKQRVAHYKWFRFVYPFIMYWGLNKLSTWAIERLSKQ